MGRGASKDHTHTQTAQREEKMLENAQQERYQVGIALGLMTKQGLYRVTALNVTRKGRVGRAEVCCPIGPFNPYPAHVSCPHSVEPYHQEPWRAKFNYFWPNCWDLKNGSRQHTGIRPKKFRKYVLASVRCPRPIRRLLMAFIRWL